MLQLSIQTPTRIFSEAPPSKPPCDLPCDDARCDASLISRTREIVNHVQARARTELVDSFWGGFYSHAYFSNPYSYYHYYSTIIVVIQKDKFVRIVITIGIVTQMIKKMATLIGTVVVIRIIIPVTIIVIVTMIMLLIMVMACDVRCDLRSNRTRKIVDHVPIRART